MTTLRDVVKEYGDTSLTVAAIADAVERISTLLYTRTSKKTSSLGVNGYDDVVKDVDKHADDIFKDLLLGCGACSSYVSEESERIDALGDRSMLTVYVDPLDGSANVDVDGPVGSIFSVVDASDRIILAGYALYGSRTILTIAQQTLVRTFSLTHEHEDVLQCYELINPMVVCPSTGNRYSVNDSLVVTAQGDNVSVNFLTRYVNKARIKGSVSRYTGCLVADCHGVLMNGGIFIYPGTPKYPQGKLRTTFEVEPFAFVFRAAGGMAMTWDGKDIVKGQGYQRGCTRLITTERSTFVCGSTLSMIDYFST